MSRDRRSDVKMSYWLTMCVLLMYHQPAEMSLTLDAAIDMRTGPDPIDPRCAEWEVFDGTDCVCADADSARCSGRGGMVCDNTGAQYTSACKYALAICQEEIPLDRYIETCGTCKYVQLLAGPENEIVTTFSRIGPPNDGLATEYLSHSDHLLLFYAHELNAWAVGRKTVEGTFIAMRQVLNSSYPEDDSGGMLIATQAGGDIDWKLDPFMHFECIQHLHVAEKHRHKRFFFLAFVFVAVATTATTTTLKVVQAAKGCLYYPSVCSLRDKIRDDLKPEVTRLRDRFISTYGDPGKFKQRVDTIHDQVLDVRDKLTTVKELHVQLKLHLDSLTVLSSSIQDEFPDIKNALTNYNEWAKNLEKMASINLLLLQLEVMMTLPALVATSVGTFALAAAGIGALLAVGFAVVDIISSVNEEKKVRNELRDTESKYLKAKSDLESAFTNVEQFQKQFCKTVVAFFRDLSGKGRAYHQSFQSLYSYVVAEYGHSISDCGNKYSKSNLGTLTKLGDQKIQPLINFLAKDIEELRRKIAEIEESNAFLAAITKLVKSDLKSPTTIFRAIKTSKPKFMSKTFVTLWDLLHFIAKQVLPSTPCYWGYNLADIRLGTTTKANYNQASVCNSHEIQTNVETIKQGVSRGYAPCKIFRQVQGQVFRSRYSVVRFIADHVITTSGCYWGYDFATIRSGHSNVKEVDTALINSGLFQTIGYFKASSISAEQVTIARDILCTAHTVCSANWQSFILCHTWKGHDAIKTLGCSGTGNSDTSAVCIPGTQHFETCS